MPECDTELNRLILAVSFWPTGATNSGWRAKGSYNKGIFDPVLLSEVARTAERGVFDYFFLGNSYTSQSDSPSGVLRRAFQLNGFAATSYLAGVTQNIGLVATINTTLLDPYHIAQISNGIDHLSRGRLGINVVTGAQNDLAYLNFSLTENPDSAYRYSRAAEFTEIFNRLQSSWDSDWYLGDKETGLLLNSDAAHRIDFQGEHFQVAGPLNAPPSPQGRVPIIHAGTSEESFQYGAKYVDVRFSPYVSPEWNREYVQDKKRRLVQAGRAINTQKTVVGAVFYPGETVSAARELHNEVERGVMEDFAPEVISKVFGVDPHKITPHARVLDVLKVDPGAISGGVEVNQHQAVGATNIVVSLENAIDAYGSDDITFLDLFRFLVNKNHFPVVVGDAERISDWIEEGYRSGSFDGVKFFPPFQRTPFLNFVDFVVPELQRRGVTRSSYDTATLRGHLGLDSPGSEK